MKRTSAAVDGFRLMELSNSGVVCRYSLTRSRYSRRERLELRRRRYSNHTKSGGENISGGDHFSENMRVEDRKIDAAGNDFVSHRVREETKIATYSAHGSISVIGRRREMEDAVRVEVGFLKTDATVYDFYGVYDGHGGPRVAEACRDRLHRLLVREIEEREAAGKTWKDWEEVMVAGFEKMDEEVKTAGNETVMTGSTAVVAVVGAEEVVVANCGDSRAVMSRGGVPLPLSNDHKPERGDELERIEGAGGKVINWNGHRVLGVLATSRSIGDHYLKPFVIPKPEVTVSKRTTEDEFLILATDGLWDVVSNDLACQVVRSCLDGRMKRRFQVTANESNSNEGVNESRTAEAAAVLAELAMLKGSRDNISVVVVDLS